MIKHAIKDDKSKDSCALKSLFSPLCWVYEIMKRRRRNAEGTTVKTKVDCILINFSTANKQIFVSQPQCQL